jgi:hypothetical protein
LAAAHEAHVIHHDVKPDNVWLEEPTGKAKLLDFGLAVISSGNNTRKVVGTPGYMSPEQLMGEPTGVASDLYSLGAILYRLTTGKLPMNGRTVSELVRMIDTPPPSVLSLNPSMTPALGQLIDRMVDRDVTRRPQSATEVLEILTELERPRPIPVDLVTPIPTPTVSPARASATNTWATVSQPDENTVVRLTPMPPSRWKITTAVLLGVFGVSLIAVVGLWAVWPNSRSQPPTSTKPPPRPPEPKPTTTKPGTTTGKPDPTPNAPPTHELLRPFVAAMQAKNPQFDGVVEPTIEDGKVIGVKFLTTNVTDLSPVRDLPDLRQLDARGPHSDVKTQYGRLVDLSPLKGLTLHSLNVAHNPILDLSPLRGVQLGYIDIEHTQVVDLSPLEGMPLVGLNLYRLENLTDVRPLRGMQLKMIFAGWTNVTDWSALANSPLEIGHFGPNPADVRVLTGCPLKSLVVWSPCVVPDELRNMPTLNSINGLPVTDFWRRHDVRRAAETVSAKRTVPTAGRIEALSFSSTGVIAHGHDFVTVHPSTAGRDEVRLPTSPGPAHAAWTTNNRLFYIATDGVVKKFSMADKSEEPFTSLSGTVALVSSPDGVRTAVLHPDGDHWVIQRRSSGQSVSEPPVILAERPLAFRVGNTGPTVVLTSRRQLKSYPKGQTAPMALTDLSEKACWAINSDGRIAAVVSDNRLRLWNLQTAVPMNDGWPVYSARCVATNGKTTLVGTDDGWVEWYETGQQEVSGTIRVGETVLAVGWVGQTGQFATAHPDAVRFWPGP